MSWLRLGLLKRALPTALLALGDRALQKTGWMISPSIFLDLRADKPAAAPLIASDDPLAILRCPETGSPLSLEWGRGREPRRLALGDSRRRV